MHALIENNGYSPLHLAATFGHADVIHELLQNERLEVNLPYRTGETPMHCAAVFGHSDAVRELLRNERVE
eukprot:4732110-Amphidinium_carterae.1